MIKDDLGNRRFFGIYRGIVFDNNDPNNTGRLRLQIPQVFGDSATGWAWGVNQVDVVRHLPEIGDGVFVAFEGGDPSYPIWLGTFTGLTAPKNWGSFYDTTAHHIASTTTAYPLTFNSSDGGEGISIVDGSKITVTHGGVYNVQFSAQVANTDNAIYNANLWIRQNGTDIPASNGQLTVPAAHGRVDGQMVSSWNYLLELNSNDYIEFFWQAESTSVFLEALAAGTTPVTPMSPSIAATITQVK
jgi:hypothetical protein